MMRRSASLSLRLLTLLILASMPAASQAQQECYDSCPSGTVCFPLGYLSFADVVLGTEHPDCEATGDFYMNPNAALGEPNYSPCDATNAPGSYALGLRGVLKVGFDDNLMINTGSPAPDLHVFEVGENPENVFVGVHPADIETRMQLESRFTADADGYFAVGSQSFPGGTQPIDLDAYFTGFGPGALRFNAVKITDAPEPPTRSCSIIDRAREGADIDAVGAISAVPFEVEPFRCVGDCGAIDLFGCTGDNPSTNPNDTDFGKCAGPTSPWVGGFRRIIVHVYARLSAAEGGITGAADFHVRGWEAIRNEGWSVSETANSAGIPFGSMTRPSGASIVLFTCQDPANNLVFLGAIDAFGPGDLPSNTYIRVVQGNGSDPNCAKHVLCDAPAFTQLCVNGGQFIINPSGRECTVAVRAESWTRIKQLYR